MSVIGLKIFVICVNKILGSVSECCNNASHSHLTSGLHYLHIEILLFRSVLDSVEVRYFRGQKSGLPVIKNALFSILKLNIKYFYVAKVR